MSDLERKLRALHGDADHCEHTWLSAERQFDCITSPCLTMLALRTAARLALEEAAELVVSDEGAGDIDLIAHKLRARAVELLGAP